MQFAVFQAVLILQTKIPSAYTLYKTIVNCIEKFLCNDLHGKITIVI